MKNKNRKIALILLVIFELIILVSTVFNLIARDWRRLEISALAIISFFIPFIINKTANKRKIILAPNFEIISIIYIFLALYLGELNGFYDKFWWWDLLLHGIFGSYAFIVALYLKEGIITSEREVTKKRYRIFILTFAFCFAITIGVLWEVFEFLGDYFFKTSMVKGGIEDTMTDMIVKIVFAFITSLIYYFRNKN